MDQVRTFLSGLYAGGGGDVPEDVLGGIQQALNATWMQASRCIIHIADAPGHSRDLPNMPKTQDRKYYTPGSEPHGLTYTPLISRLVELEINYTFLNIDDLTDRMLMAFSRVYEASGAEIRLRDANQYHHPPKIGGSGNRVAGRPGTTNTPQLLFQELSLGVNINDLRNLVLRSVTDSATRTATHHSTALLKGSSRLSASDVSRPSKLSPPKCMLSSVRKDEPDSVKADLEETPPQWNSRAG